MHYAERLSVPLRWWAQGTMLVASLWFAVLVGVPEDLEWVAWAVTAVAIGLMAAGFLTYGSARLVVGDGHLQAGRARIPLALVGDVKALDAQSMRLKAGRDADARAYLVLRPYLKRGVQVEVVDPADPTPYWLVSCRRPDRVRAAVESFRATSGAL